MGDTQFRKTGRRMAQGPYRTDERIRRRTEGEARNALWQSRTPTEQRASLMRRPGKSRRQIAKLV